MIRHIAFLTLLLRISYFYSKEESQFNNKEDRITEGNNFFSTKENEHQRLKEASCRIVLKSILKDKRISNSLSPQEGRKYELMLNKCLEIITDDQIEQFSDNSALPTLPEKGVLQQLINTVTDPVLFLKKEEISKEALKQTKAKENWEFIKMNLIIIAFFSCGIILILLIVFLKNKFTSSADLNKKTA